MVETFIDKPARWLDGAGSEADLVLFTKGTLARNLADFPFPSRCTAEDARAVEERILGALDQTGLLAEGQYFSLLEAGPQEARFFHERHLVTAELLRRGGPRGVFVKNDQSLSIMINEANHTRICVTASGLEPEAVWSRLSSVDDTLTGALDFAFDERLGYLTPLLGQVGTGLNLLAALHLPALAIASKILGAEQRVREQRHVLQGLMGSISAAQGDVYALSNQSTLGRSEEEIVYHLRHIAQELMDQERTEREVMTNDGHLSLEDRINRALGSARGARLLEMDEGLDILSSLRLGLSTKHLEGFRYKLLNELFVESQPAHLELRRGAECDEVTLSVERANLFRTRLS